jgi:hypothetical protein
LGVGGELAEEFPVSFDVAQVLREYANSRAAALRPLALAPATSC